MLPDLLHTFYSLSWLSLAGETGVQAEMDVALGVARGTAERLGRYLPIAPATQYGKSGTHLDIDKSWSSRDS